MKQAVRYQTLLISGKLRTEVKITVDDSRGAEYTSTFDGNKSTSINLFPIISITIIRQGKTDDNGNKVKSPWDPNDTLIMTKYNMPIFLNELVSIQQDMKIPELYTYQGKRLELNEEVAQKVRRVFMVGDTALELVPLVIIHPNDDSRVEGIKMKFNNEQSSILLTLNDLDSLIYNLKNLDVDSVSLLTYLNYITKATSPKTFNSAPAKPKVDIVPKVSEFSMNEVPF